MLSCWVSTERIFNPEGLYINTDLALNAGHSHCEMYFMLIQAGTTCNANSSNVYIWYNYSKLQHYINAYHTWGCVSVILCFYILKLLDKQLNGELNYGRMHHLASCMQFQLMLAWQPNYCIHTRYVFPEDHIWGSKAIKNLGRRVGFHVRVFPHSQSYSLGPWLSSVGPWLLQVLDRLAFTFRSQQSACWRWQSVIF